MMTANERYYRKTMGAIGGAMLFFLLLVNAFSGLMAGLTLLLEIVEMPTVTRTVCYELIYAVGYLLSFMLPVPFLKWLLKRGEHTWRPMYAPFRISRRIPLILFAGMALIFSAAYLNASFVSIFSYSDFSSEIIWQEGGAQQPYEIVLQFIVMCVVPAFCEEFLFRGAILTNCLPFGRTNAILISALLFGLMHQNAEQILYAFLAGILLGVVYELTGSIWNCIFLHLFNNFFSMLETVLEDQMQSQLTQTVATAIFELTLFLLGILSLVILIRACFSQRKDFREGVFGRSVPASDYYAEYPVSARSAVRHFLTPTMIIFLCLCVLQIILLLGMAVLYATF